MPSRNTQQRGFSLIELLVGVAITLIATIVIFQVFAVSERHKRTTTGVSDAQTNGALSLYILEREIRMAGSGYLTSTVLDDCDPTKTFTYYKGPDGTVTNPKLMTPPVLITDGAPGESDLITVNRMSSSSDPGTNPNVFGRISLAPGKAPHYGMPGSSSELDVQSTVGCQEGGMLLMVQPCTVLGTTTPKNSCTLMQITQVQDQSLKLQHNPGQGADETWNPPNSYQNANNWPAYKANESCQAYGICIPKLDPGMTQSFGINNNNLTVNNNLIAPGIIDLQAEYGITADTTGGTSNITWQPPTGAWAGPNLTADQIKQIKAVRIAMVARSGEYEKPTNAAGVCQTTTAAPKFSWGTFNTSNATKWPTTGTNDWRCYRYKVFETEVPLINIIWMNMTKS